MSGSLWIEVILPDTEFNQKDLAAEVACSCAFCALRSQVLIQASEFLAAILHFVWIVLDVTRPHTGCTGIEWQIHLSWRHYCYCLDYYVLSDFIFVSNYLVKQGCRISRYTFQTFFLLKTKPFLLSCFILILSFPTTEESVLPGQCNEHKKNSQKVCTDQFK